MYYFNENIFFLTFNQKKNIAQLYLKSFFKFDNKKAFLNCNLKLFILFTLNKRNQFVQSKHLVVVYTLLIKLRVHFFLKYDNYEFKKMHDNDIGTAITSSLKSHVYYITLNLNFDNNYRSSFQIQKSKNRFFQI